ncbi:hypothetical protein [Paenibacillus sp. PAMC21692]|uniref:hypothetical protein n=1 Tax=Paenibacillus sp. PAMC21692 TaxID=2762320 RepID=UPI00164D5E0E|nr:hypothetical protein [Paenibacillus sp. PAMC21692]QNK59407.1 hypothetical protein H7F31_11290 [Paenibacillus sp. PAMC21692]
MFDDLPSPRLLSGNDRRAYRDPCAVYHEGIWFLYYTLAETEADGQVYLYTAMSESGDLRHWSKPHILTPRNRGLNYSSPGNIVFHNNKWHMCLQTYPRPNGEKYGNADCRLWMMESDDLRHWSPPELLLVKGGDTGVREMGRMIDPYLVEHADKPGEWYCFYKQNGVSYSRTDNFREWIYGGSREAGENVCIIRHGGEYVMFHSPENGIGVMRSSDLTDWRDDGELITLGQKDWEWAMGRITAGFVIDLRHVAGIEAFVVFYHGSGPEDESVLFDTHASIGVAWSKDLTVWDWPGKFKPVCTNIEEE